jgi:hypothetical protein
MWNVQQDLWAYVGRSLYYNIYGQKTLMVNGCGSTEMRSQDSGIYPDLQVSLNYFLTYYDTLRKYRPTKYIAYDNVIILNTFFASDMVSLVEPLILDDCTVVTSANLAKTIFADRNETSMRKANIGPVVKQAEGKFSSISSDKFGSIFDTIISTIQAKNIAFYSKNPTMEKYFDDLGMTGRIAKNFKGDYFNLSEAQVCGLKANFYLYDTVTQNVKIADNGNVSKSVQVKWENDKVYSRSEEDIISKVGGIYAMRFPYRAWIRFFTPPGTVFTSSDGYSKSRYLYYSPVTYLDEKLNKQTNDNVIWFNHLRMTSSQPAPTYTLNVAYNLPAIAKYSNDNGYQMLVQKHPGKKDEKYTVNLSYKGKSYNTTFRLTRDMLVVFKDGALSVQNYTHPLDEYKAIIEAVMPAKK